MRLSCLFHAGVRLVRAALILLTSGIVAGGVMLAILFVIDLIMMLVGAPMQFRGGVLVGMVAFPFWLIGACVVGPPLWAALHFSHVRDRRTAVVAGAVAGSIGVLVGLWLTLSPDALASVAVLSAVGGISGAVAGEAIHRMAYRSGDIAHAR